VPALIGREYRSAKPEQATISTGEPTGAGVRRF
jgi:hypothetical protein